MNREAQRMGMKNTRFANPHGLPSPKTIPPRATCRSLAARVIVDFPEFYKIDSVKSFTYNKITQPNRNRLLWLDPTVDGMKTGHTEAAGYCMIASAKRPNGNLRAPPDFGRAGHQFGPDPHRRKARSC
jgi:D-alanyl-D-alanine carboxypeptidase (penicillin-binding protein 5/6)